MPLTMICPPCGESFAADDEETLVRIVQDHARDEHDRIVPQDEILEHVTVAP